MCLPLYARRLVFALLVIFSLPACAEAPDAEPAGDPQPPAVVAAAAPAGVQPDTTADAMWSYLQGANYQQTWRMWPGKDRLYPGVEPHGMLLTTYVNELAYQALAAGSTTLPPGAVIVKENYMPDSTFAAVTTMYKAPGYNPAHQDWFFAKHDPQGVMEVAGRAAMCQACHNSAPGGDYLFTELPR